VKTKRSKASAVQAAGQCICGAIKFEIDVPARWAWHDHSEASRRAHGAAYVTYVGSYKSRFRILKGSENITRFEDKPGRGVRRFCTGCGTPLAYERAHAHEMINIPRALFEARTGREPRYHLHLEQAPEWAYRGETLAPLKGYPGVMWERPKRKKRAEMLDPMF
jgi:hypothetical protein